jgi:hypothetical protein
MLSRFSRILIKQFGWVWLALFLLPASSHGQSDAKLNLEGAIDFHVHQGPDSVDRAIDADDLARLAKKMGMRGMVMKNHWEDTAALAYMVRKEVPGIELFGGITQDLAVGGINLEAVKHMVAMKGGWGRLAANIRCRKRREVRERNRSIRSRFGEWPSATRCAPVD